MLDMKLNSGKFVIDDDNQVHVDSQIEEEINKKFEENEDNEGKVKPDMIKD